MSWNNATRDIPFFEDYAAAAKYEAEVVPIRGKSPEVKPLGSRKKPYLRIKKADNGDIQILYDDDPLVVFQPDGYIKVSGCHYSSLHGVQGSILAVDMRQHDNHPWISRVLAPCDPDGDKLGAFPVRMGVSKNLFRREPDGYLRYVNPLYPTQHVVKRKEMKALRKKYPEFRKFAHAMIKVQGIGEPMTQEFMAAMWGSEEHQLVKTVYQRGLRIHYPQTRTAVDTLSLIESGDTAKWADAVTYLCWTRHRWRTLWDLGAFNAEMNTTLTYLLGDEVFEEKTITTGKWVKDPNKRSTRGLLR